MDLSDQAFLAVTDLFHQVSGIRLSGAKRALVAGRLRSLAAEAGSASLDDYVHGLVHHGSDDERVRVIDRLTTNETYFFREPAHFDRLEEIARDHPADGAPLRVWSAASSTGEEAYSIAMVLASVLGAGTTVRARWEIVGTDLSTQVVDAARRALYPMERARDMPQAMLKRWCLRGEGPYEGRLLIERALRDRVRFLPANLMEPLPPIGDFDVIFLRNVLIYFDNAGKQRIVDRVTTHLKPGGLLFAGHAESLSGLDLDRPLRSVAPAVYALA